MNFEEMIERISKLMPIFQVMQAEHCGAGYFCFYGEDLAKKVCRAAIRYEHVVRPTASLSVHIDDNDNLEYRVHLSPNHFGDFTECLEAEFV